VDLRRPWKWTDRGDNLPTGGVLITGGPLVDADGKALAWVSDRFGPPHIRFEPGVKALTEAAPDMLALLERAVELAYADGVEAEEAETAHVMVMRDFVEQMRRKLAGAHR
jgi:hypothetical protein